MFKFEKTVGNTSVRILIEDVASYFEIVGLDDRYRIDLSNQEGVEEFLFFNLAFQKMVRKAKAYPKTLDKKDFPFNVSDTLKVEASLDDLKVLEKVLQAVGAILTI